MENKILKDSQVKMILNESFDETFWLYQLGLSVTDEDISFDKRFSYDFFDAGKKYWNNIKDKLKDLMCDNDKQEPKILVSGIIEENNLALIDQIASIITGHLHLELTIAIPLTSLILKKGLRNFCKNN